jgi:phosphoglycerate dehydrogenase-like enzyme
MKAVLHYRASPWFRDRLRKVAPGWLEVAVVDEFDKSAFSLQMRDADVLLHVLEPVTAEIIAGAPALRLIQKIGVGLNTIDLEAARRKGVAVVNMPGVNSQAVAEMTLALMLAALRRVPHLDRAMRAGNGWSQPPELFDTASEIGGKTVGLVGYGAVPRRIAPVLQALGATVLYTATRPREDAAGRWTPLPELLQTSDIVSLHLPLNASTRLLIDRAAIASMKRGGVLVNTARGALVDEQALCDALREGHLRAAALDVMTEEPAGGDNPLFALDNVVVSPHVAWLTPETLERGLDIAMENCSRLRSGDPLLYQAL